MNILKETLSPTPTPSPSRIFSMAVTSSGMWSTGTHESSQETKIRGRGMRRGLRQSLQALNYNNTLWRIKARGFPKICCSRRSIKKQGCNEETNLRHNSGWSTRRYGASAATFKGGCNFSWIEFFNIVIELCTFSTAACIWKRVCLFWLKFNAFIFNLPFGLQKPRLVHS